MKKDLGFKSMLMHDLLIHLGTFIQISLEHILGGRTYEMLEKITLDGVLTMFFHHQNYYLA